MVTKQKMYQFYFQWKAANVEEWMLLKLKRRQGMGGQWFVTVDGQNGWC